MARPTEYENELEQEAFLVVRFSTERDAVVQFAVVLVKEIAGRRHTIRVFDNTHGVNDMHRYHRRGGKQPAEVFSEGTAGEAMNTAIELIRRSYREMIAGWQR